MSADRPIKLHDIRAHEGSQARAWEELTYQLRDDPSDPLAEVRKTRAPDGGVEWYYIFPDGHEEGFQAKFNADLASALGGMRESVRAVAEKRPSMTRLTFLVPYDFTDSGKGPSKSDQDRWADAVESWHQIPGAADLDFAVVRAGDIVDKLTQAPHAGRRSYWFGGMELTRDWLERRWEESRALAGIRYTPEADTPTALTEVLDGVVLAPQFISALRVAVDRTIERCRRDEGMWGSGSASAEKQVAALQGWATKSLEHPDPDDADGRVQLPTGEWDLSAVVAATTALSALGARRRAHSDVRTDDLDRAMDAVDALARLADTQIAHLSQERVAAVVGPAGQGKTHALMALGRRLLDERVPAVVVLGSRLSDSTWWDAMSAALGGLSGTSDEFLQAMDSLAQAQGRRGAIIIDALNETQSPKRWRAELLILKSQVKRYPNLALIVSFRSDWAPVVMDAGTMSTYDHPGLAGREEEALSRYCALFDIPEPTVTALDPAFSSPLFLRMFCEVLQQEGPTHPQPTRSDLFNRFAAARTRQVIDRLSLAPTSTVVHDAMLLVTDSLIARAGLAVPRAQMEPSIDALLPGRPWPDTLFGAMTSEGLIEIGPSFDGNESVSLPFQSYSEHLLAGRVLDTSSTAESSAPFVSPHGTAAAARLNAQAVKDHFWLWRALAVLIPERYGVELTDVLGSLGDLRELDDGEQSYLSVNMAQGFTDRKPQAFTARALELVETALRNGPTDAEADAILALAARPGHPAGAAWLHRTLVALSMPERDACWSIGTYYAESESATYRRLVAWATDNRDGTEPETESVATVFAWLLTSPNRFMRDEVTKALVRLLARRLDLMAKVLGAVRNVDDPYVVQRVFLAAYGALMVGGDTDLDGARKVIDEFLAWETHGLPVDVLARDSARGALAWGAEAGIASPVEVSRFAPPYGADPPTEPPTSEALERDYGPLGGPGRDLNDWRAGSILRSCLTWMGDFNKYVVKSDVATFTRAPLTGPAPTPLPPRGLQGFTTPVTTAPALGGTSVCKLLGEALRVLRGLRALRPIAAKSQAAPSRSHPGDDETTDTSPDLNAEVDADWAGRWIADRAINLGWTTTRFAEFEQDIASRDRDAHKAERFGKKYQWIALHELLARLADNYHLTPDRWSNTRATYVGPWTWYGRDLDPTLPPSRKIEGARVCLLGSMGETWAAVHRNDLGSGVDAAEWVSDDTDLPDPDDLFEVADPQGHRWIVLERYASWSRNDSRRQSMSRRTRDLFFIQFAWLVPAGQGKAVVNHLRAAHLAGRWMPDPVANTQQYLGEGPWSVIEETTVIEPDVPTRLAQEGLSVRVALSNYLWEAGGHDCSIDQPVNVYKPVSELLGPARWVPYQTAWRQPPGAGSGDALSEDNAGRDPSDDGDRVVVRTLDIEDDLDPQSAVIADHRWLMERLGAIDADLVIGTLSEKTVIPPRSTPADDQDFHEPKPIWTDITYLSLLLADGTTEHSGPITRRRRPDDDIPQA